MVMMDTESFEQLLISKNLLEDKLPFLSDNMIVEVEFHEERPIGIELPQSVIAEVVETDPVIRGATATSSYKPAILANGVKVMVPAYLTIGEKIVVRTEDSSFVERAK
jgi:elongation factor P